MQKLISLVLVTFAVFGEGSLSSLFSRKSDKRVYVGDGFTAGSNTGSRDRDQGSVLRSTNPIDSQLPSATSRKPMGGWVSSQHNMDNGQGSPSDFVSVYDRSNSVSPPLGPQDGTSTQNQAESELDLFEDLASRVRYWPFLPKHSNILLERVAGVSRTEFEFANGRKAELVFSHADGPNLLMLLSKTPNSAGNLVTVLDHSVSSILMEVMRILAQCVHPFKIKGGVPLHENSRVPNLEVVDEAAERSAAIYAQYTASRAGDGQYLLPVNRLASTQAASEEAEAENESEFLGTHSEVLGSQSGVSGPRENLHAETAGSSSSWIKTFASAFGFSVNPSSAQGSRREGTNVARERENFSGLRGRQSQSQGRGQGAVPTSGRGATSDRGGPSGHGVSTRQGAASGSRVLVVAAQPYGLDSSFQPTSTSGFQVDTWGDLDEYGLTLPNRLVLERISGSVNMRLEKPLAKADQLPPRDQRPRDRFPTLLGIAEARRESVSDELQIPPMLVRPRGRRSSRSRNSFGSDEDGKTSSAGRTNSGSNSSSPNSPNGDDPFPPSAMAQSLNDMSSLVQTDSLKYVYSLEGEVRTLIVKATTIVNLLNCLDTDDGDLDRSQMGHHGFCSGHEEFVAHQIHSGSLTGDSASAQETPIPVLMRIDRQQFAHKISELKAFVAATLEEHMSPKRPVVYNLGSRGGVEAFLERAKDFEKTKELEKAQKASDRTLGETERSSSSSTLEKDRVTRKSSSSNPDPANTSNAPTEVDNAHTDVDRVSHVRDFSPVSLDLGEHDRPMTQGSLEIQGRLIDHLQVVRPAQRRVYRGRMTDSSDEDSDEDDDVEVSTRVVIPRGALSVKIERRCSETRTFGGVKIRLEFP